MSKIIMTTKKLKAFFEENEFNVFLTKQDGVQCAEIEKWTNGGVDMIMWLNPFTVEEFKGYVKDFDVDEEISLLREAKDYCNTFTLRQSLEDFEAFEKHLEETIEKLDA